jgi:ADP-heptose:LPS heptosyltransferase
LKKKRNIYINFTDAWINPTGGYGDILMLSGVLKQCLDKNPEVKFNVVRRAIYTDLLKGHPAIKRYGYPPKNANIITTNYWLKEKLGVNNQRPYQILARLFGLQTPIEEELYLPGEYNNEDRLLQDFVLKEYDKIAIIAPSSISPRKMMEPMIWQNFVEKLRRKGIFIIQVGNRNDIYIKGTYSLLGLTTLRQLISLMIKSDVIISVDNLIMHAAHLIKKPAIIIWGPTNYNVYGYPEQTHIQCSTNNCEFQNRCLGPDFPENYYTPCPFHDRHCMSKVSINEMIENVIDILPT